MQFTPENQAHQNMDNGFTILQDSVRIIFVPSTPQAALIISDHALTYNLQSYFHPKLRNTRQLCLSRNTHL